MIMPITSIPNGIVIKHQNTIDDSGTKNITIFIEIDPINSIGQQIHQNVPPGT